MTKHTRLQIQIHFTSADNFQQNTAAEASGNLDLSMDTTSVTTNNTTSPPSALSSTIEMSTSQQLTGRARHKARTLEIPIARKTRQAERVLNHLNVKLSKLGVDETEKARNFKLVIAHNARCVEEVLGHLKGKLDQLVIKEAEKAGMLEHTTTQHGNEMLKRLEVKMSQLGVKETNTVPPLSNSGTIIPTPSININDAT